MEIVFKKILVPVDASKSCRPAISMAIEIARICGADFHLVNVKENQHMSFSGDLSTELDEELLRHIREDIIAEVEGQGIKVVFHRKSGIVYEEIVSAANEIKADLIVMGTHGVSGFKEFWMGSNAFRVVSSAKCPVFTIQENYRDTKIKSMVLPLDSTYSTRQKVPVAAALAKIFGSNIYVLGISENNYDLDLQYVKSYVMQSVDYLNEKGIKNSWEIVGGKDISDLIIDFSEKKQADAIIIMTESELSVKEMFMGPYAQHLVNHSKIPVLTMGQEKELMVYGKNLGGY